MAAWILRMNGDANPLGKKWISSFLQRNPRVASVVGQKIEACQIDGTTPEQLRAFFNLFQRTQHHLQVSTQNIWNIDEQGIALGIYINTQVLASSQKSRTYIKAL